MSSEKVNENAIKSVSVVSTGSVEIHPEHAYGTKKPLYWWILTSRQWTPPCPINVYVIEHPDGLVLFDAGQDRASVTDPDYFPGGFTGLIYKRLARFQIGPTETLTDLLGGLGYSTDDVTRVVISHLHQDHIGGIRELPEAEFVVSDVEWQDMLKPLPEARGILRDYIDIPDLTWRRVLFEPTDDPALEPFREAYDLMGDGSMVLLPTPGHTPGSISMLARRSDGPSLLFVGDLTYEADLLERGIIPGVGDKRQLRETTSKVVELERRMGNFAILPAHDPYAVKRVDDISVVNTNSSSFIR